MGVVIVNTALGLTATVVAAALAFTPGSTAGQEPRRITLDEAMALFTRDNLDLRLARAEAAEANALASQAMAWTNPTIASTHEPLSRGGDDYSESYITLSQRLDWPGKRGAQRQVANGVEAAARARLAADSARIAFAVKRAYTEAGQAERAEQVLARVVTVFRDGQRSAEERFGAGDISLYELQRIRVERMRYETLVAEAELEAARSRRTLAVLLAPMAEDLELAPSDARTGPPPPVAPEHVIEMALERRREVAAAEAVSASARSSASVARRRRLPDLTATGGYKRQSDGFSGAFLGLSLPLPLWDRRDGAIRAADAQVSATESRLALTRRLVENDVRRALATHRSLTRRAGRLAEPLTVEASDLLEIAQVAYEEGEMELIELLDAAEAFRTARFAETRLRADLWISYYDLERAVGGFGGVVNEGEGR